MARNSIGLVELGSIAAGYQVSDAMLKAADVEIVLARTICSGKYMVMVRGDVAAVQAGVQAGRARARSPSSTSSSSPTCTKFHFPGHERKQQGGGAPALGVLESFSVASSSKARTQRRRAPMSR